MNHLISRRQVLLGGTAAAAAASLLSEPLFGEQPGASVTPLEELAYEQVALRGAAQIAQRENVASILMGFSDDSLLKPYREMAGKPGPGASLGGWYEWKPNYDYHHDDAGLAPGSSFGQWMSALARLDTAARFGGAAGDGAMAERVVRLNGLLGETIDKTFFEQTRFPGYTYDKLTCGLMDAHRLLGDKAAFATLNRVADAAVPSFTGHVIERDIQWKVGYDPSWIWDEVYTIPENQYLVWKMGAGDRYKRLAEQTRDDKTLFEPLSLGVNVLGDRHAYSHVNCLCSAMQAYLSDGSAMHFEAAKNGFSIVEQQSFATGGWGPEELLRKPGYDEVFKSLAASRNSFETPCGAYAHMKLTRYLLRATRDGHFGDSMEKVMLNTVLGSLPLQPDGRSFYSSDYSTVGKRIYSQHRWPCCSGTLPQVVADYGINTYLRERGALWVNLYQPSEVRWTEAGKSFAVEQTGTYPEEDVVRLKVSASSPGSFALKLRVPAWAAGGAALRVNGKPQPINPRQGFATVERLWRTGDLLELSLPMSLRLEPLPGHPELVAPMWGPWVLFALREPGETLPLKTGADTLLKAERTGPREWRVGDRRMVPFTEVQERTYATYWTLA